MCENTEACELNVKYRIIRIRRYSYNIMLFFFYILIYYTVDG